MEKDKRLISYGASIGAEWTKEQYTKIRGYFEISVREADTCKMLA